VLFWLYDYTRSSLSERGEFVSDFCLTTFFFLVVVFCDSVEEGQFFVV
jgi:hypothetical protein